MKPWELWVLASAVLTLVEVASVTLVFLMLAGGAAAAAIASVAGANAPVQIIVFTLGSIGLLGAVRPIANRHLHAGSEHRTGVAALIGREATVVQRVEDHSGQVRIGGEIWTARAYDGHTEYEVGAKVDVAQIEGATALVL